MTAALLGLFSGAVAGICISSVWLALEIPMRVSDVCAAGDIRLMGLALALGGLIASLPFSLPLGEIAGALALVVGGAFVGVLASALTEVLQVIPALYDRFGIDRGLKLAPFAMAIGKTGGAIVAGIMKL